MAWGLFVCSLRVHRACSHLSYCRPSNMLDVIREQWEKGPSKSKNEIYRNVDLRAKFNNLSYLTPKNLPRNDSSSYRNLCNEISIRIITLIELHITC